MPIIEIFNTILFNPIVNMLVLIMRGFQAIGMPGAFGFAIVVLTVLIRLLVWPFMAIQLKSAKKMAELKPLLDILKEKHKDDKKALAAAQMALYKENGVNPAGGCLPSLIQIPIIIALYQTIFAFFSNGDGLVRINNALYVPAWHFDVAPDLTFFGVNLANKPSQFSSLGWAILLVPIVTVLLQFFQSKMMAPKVVKQYPSDSPKEKGEKKSTEDSMAAVQSQMMYMMPLMVGYFAFQFPVGVAIYWNTFTILGIIQQHHVSGWGGLQNWLKALKVIK